MLRIMINLPDEYRPLVQARRKTLQRSSLSHYGRCLIDDDLGLTPINHHAHAAAASGCSADRPQASIRPPESHTATR